LADRTEINPEDFRRALSCFATGVAVVTTLDALGEKVGMTISSFNSVSLDPPLVLWSVADDSLSYDDFIEADYFAVHVLAMNQKDLSDRFAQSGENKFDKFNCREGLHGVPILPEFAACFECSTEHIYPGGDHKIIVGRVQRFEDRETDPLIVYRSRFLRKESPS
jgi:3-hydroxy-9,10-secoandrosta-1,3,5(10)-triene-9,17-dione monooxygenase reductase component